MKTKISLEEKWFLISVLNSKKLDIKKALDRPNWDIDYTLSVEYHKLLTEKINLIDSILAKLD